MTDTFPVYRYRILRKVESSGRTIIQGMVYQKIGENSIHIYLIGTRGFHPIQGKSLEDITESDLPKLNIRSSKLLPDSSVLESNRNKQFSMGEALVESYSKEQADSSNQAQQDRI